LLVSARNRIEVLTETGFCRRGVYDGVLADIDDELKHLGGLDEESPLTTRRDARWQ